MNWKMIFALPFCIIALASGLTLAGCEKPAPRPPAPIPVASSSVPQLLTAITPTAETAPAQPATTNNLLLYNGIRLPMGWPPKDAYQAGEPMVVPYLTNPPAVIPIDVGRQLFVDDFLIESTTLTRTFHHAEPYTNNPVLRPDQPWEMEGKAPMAMVFSDGVWFDAKEKIFKMWYMGGYARHTCYATSTNGVDWVKPQLDVKTGSNIVQPDARDSSTVWLDATDPDPKRRFKMFRSTSEDKQWGLSVHFSPDGIHWDPRAIRTGPAGDRTTVFWNPFRQVWVYSLRSAVGSPRTRSYWENTDLVNGLPWTKVGDTIPWVGADRLDPPREDLQDKPQLYNLDAVAYENLFVGLFTIWRGDRNIPPGRPKPNSIFLGFSRDGYHWSRPDRTPFIPVSEKQGDWNWGNVQSAGGGFLVWGRKLLFYFSGRAGAPDKRDAGGATGLAFLRRDGFASLDADAQPGTLTTRPVKFSGKTPYLFLNTDVTGGQLLIEILDENNKPIVVKAPAPQPRPIGGPPAPAPAPNTNLVDVVFSKENNQPISNVDYTLMNANWNGVSDLSTLVGRTVKFRFHLTHGKLYSFWISPSLSGASGGFVAAGGPFFSQPIDTMGNRAYRPFPEPPPAPKPATNAPASDVDITTKKPGG